MATNYFLGQPSQIIKKWCEEKYGEKDNLKVNIVWDSTQPQNASLYINGEEKEYGSNIPMTKGDFIIKVTCNSSSDRFRRFSTEPQETDHGTYEYETTMNFQEPMEITAYFSQDWI